MAKDLRQRFDIELGDLNSSNSKGMPYLVEFHLLKTVTFQKSREELPVCSRLYRLVFARQEVMVRIVGIELLYDIHQK